MTNEQKQVRDMMVLYGQETPAKPIIPSLEVRKLRAKLILEEAFETIEKGLGLFVQHQYKDSLAFNYVYGHDTWAFVDGEEPNLEQIADGCTDIKVVSEGCMASCGLITYLQKPRGGSELRIDPIFEEVMKNNLSKLWTLIEVTKEFKDRLVLSLEPRPFGQRRTTDGFIIQELNIGDIFRRDDKPSFSVKNSDGKFIKPPSYTPPNLKAIIDEMTKA